MKKYTIPTTLVLSITTSTMFAASAPIYDDVVDGGAALAPGMDNDYILFEND